MFRMLLIIAMVVFTIHCVVELVQTKGARIRTIPRWLWLFAVICAPMVDPFTWLFAGRPSSRPRPHQLGPDDDKNFLRGLY